MTASIAAIQASHSASRDSTSVLHPAVLATLQRLERALPPASQAARVQLQEAWSAQGQTTWPELAWSFSRLTNTGMPVEFAWSSRETAVRWTADVALPEWPDAERLAACTRWLQWPQGEAVTETHLAPWHRMQAGQKLRFGAWLGMRHRCDDVEATGSVPGVHTASKLYVELPARCALPPAAARLVWRGDGAQWRMVGLQADGSQEMYGRFKDLDLGQAQTLCTQLFRHTLPAQEWTQQLRALTRGHELPRPSGLSVTWDSTGCTLALTWFCMAKALFRDDTFTRMHLLSLTKGDSARVYEALIGGPADSRWRHGMLGAGVDAAGLTWIQCGVRPT